MESELGVDYFTELILLFLRSLGSMGVSLFHHILAAYLGIKQIIKYATHRKHRCTPNEIKAFQWHEQTFAFVASELHAANTSVVLEVPFLGQVFILFVFSVQVVC